MIDTDKYEGHMVGYYFQGSNFDLEHLTMYDIHGNEIAVLKSNDKRLMGGIPFVRPTIELMVDAPLLLAEVKRLREIIGVFDEFMCNNWMPSNSYPHAPSPFDNVHSLWNELLWKVEEE